MLKKLTLAEEIETAVSTILWKKYPAFRTVKQSDLYKTVVKAATVAVIKQALNCTKHNQLLAARRVGMNRNTFMKVMKIAGLPTHAELSPEQKTAKLGDYQGLEAAIDRASMFRAAYSEKYEKALNAAKRQGYS